MKKKTFLAHLLDLRRFVIIITFVFLFIYFSFLILSFFFSSIFIEYMKKIININSIFYSGLYDSFLFPFYLAYYGVILFSINFLIVLFFYFHYKNKYINFFSIFFSIFNWYIFYKYLIPYGFFLIFKNSISKDCLIYRPELLNLLKNIFYLIICEIITIYMPIISGLIVNIFNIKKKEKFFLFVFVLVSGIVAPGDIISHLLMFSLMTIIFILITFYGKLKKLKKYGRKK